MVDKARLTKIVFAIAVTVLIFMNLYTLIAAYPETYAVDSGISTSGTIVAKDFSAYYIGAWRLWNNPAHIYSFGTLNDGEPIILPHPEGYKYLPSFLLIVSPLLSLKYQDALFAFDLIQFLILPFMAYFLYKLLDKKSFAVTFVVMAIALLLPFPTSRGLFSPSYYWQWGEGQAKVFVTFLLLLSFYLGNKSKPVLSGICMALGFFDPRFGLLAIPLFIMYNRKNLKVAGASAIGALVVSNLILLYPGIGLSFLSMAFASGLTTPLYYYSLIPLGTLLALIVVNFKELIAAFDYKRVFANFTRTTETLDG
jgi:hypothetical protein